jgi:hypothetical protein
MTGRNFSIKLKSKINKLVENDKKLKKAVQEIRGQAQF